ncbi:hypothetical protein [Alkalihalobacterium bogoriense]|uniref:hypothetical protein n=1 Tax=Alkalihalobacterium bogoriense TaxID=246272 RepID=UPI0012EB2A01|nr:hypothetical protein [Alkalihalobacterium bogoriense]
MKQKFGVLYICFFILIAVLSACQTGKIDEQQVLNHYYDVITTAQKLFENHVYNGSVYYNENIQTIEDVYALLGGKVTEDGMEQLVDRFFIEEEGKLVYRDKYQTYIEEESLYTATPENPSRYYESVRQTILNPGLQIVTTQDVSITRDGEYVVLEGTDLPIYFYEETTLSKEQYKRFGYPPSDKLSISFIFIKQGDNYLLEEYKVEG